MRLLPGLLAVLLLVACGSSGPEDEGVCRATACASSACGEQPDGCGGVQQCGPCPVETLAADLGEVHDLEAGPGGVYWVSLDRGAGVSTLWRAPLAGGTPLPLTTGQGFAAVALDATHAYLTDLTARTVVRAPLGGGSAQTLATEQGQPNLVVTDATHVYWTGSTGNAARAALAGGAPEPLRDADFPQPPVGLAVDAQAVYVGTSDGSLWRAALGTRTWTRLREPATGEALTRLAQDATHLYWSDLNAGRIWRLPKTGGTAQPLVQGEQALDLRVDDRFLYWSAAGSVRRMPREGGAASNVATGLTFPGRLALEGAHVYWLDEGSLQQRRTTLRRTLR